MSEHPHKMLIIAVSVLTFLVAFTTVLTISITGRHTATKGEEELIRSSISLQDSRFSEYDQTIVTAEQVQTAIDLYGDDYIVSVGFDYKKYSYTDKILLRHYGCLPRGTATSAIYTQDFEDDIDYGVIDYRYYNWATWKPGYKNAWILGEPYVYTHISDYKIDDGLFLHWPPYTVVYRYHQTGQVTENYAFKVDATKYRSWLCVDPDYNVVGIFFMAENVYKKCLDSGVW